MKTGFFMRSAGGGLLTLGLLLSGCAPSYYLTVKPSEAVGADKYSNGHETLVADLDSVETRLSFSHQRDKALFFEAEVRNGSDQPVLIDPARFYYEPGVTQTVASTAGAGHFIARVPAIDPEQQLQLLSTRLTTEDRKATGMSGWEWLTIIGNVTEDATANKRKETDQERAGRKDQYHRNLQSFDVAREEHGEKAYYTSVEMELWQRRMLYKYPLQPGELLRGYVVFPIVEQTAQLRVTMPIGPHHFTFDFDQQRLKY